MVVRPCNDRVEIKQVPCNVTFYFTNLVPFSKDSTSVYYVCLVKWIKTLRKQLSNEVREMKVWPIIGDFYERLEITCNASLVLLSDYISTFLQQPLSQVTRQKENYSDSASMPKFGCKSKTQANLTRTCHEKQFPKSLCECHLCSSVQDHVLDLFLINIVYLQMSK